MLKWLFGWLFGIWGDLSEDTKEKIINIIVETFDSIFRNFYNSEKEKEKNV